MSTSANNLKSIVDSRSTELIECICLSPELCASLRAKNLIAKSEYEELANFMSSDLHTKGAAFLFTSVVRKIADTDEDKFIEALREGRNERAIEILRPGASGHISLTFLDTEEFNFIKKFRQGDYTKKGKFEGLHYADEEIANGLLSESEDGGNLGASFLEGDGLLVNCEGSEEFIQRVKSSTKCLKEGTLWWNPDADRIPPNCIPRRIRRLTTSGDEGESILLKQYINVDDPFLWLIDPPGMGKSTLTTELEEEWRKSIPSWRVIVRVNLNFAKNVLKELNKPEDTGFFPFRRANSTRTQGSLSNQQKIDDMSLMEFLTRFVPFLPLDSLSRLPGGAVKVIVLLDGLDEVSPKYKSTINRILRSLLLSPKEAANRDFRFRIRFEGPCGCHDATNTLEMASEGRW